MAWRCLTSPFLREPPLICDLLIVFEAGRAQVVFGNYDTYERLRAQQRALEVEKIRRRAAPAEIATSRTRPKRRFPYRKLEDLESEITQNEATVRDLERALAEGDLYRDAERVRETMKAFEETKAKLVQLYEHWDEAAELN